MAKQSSVGILGVACIALFVFSTSGAVCAQQTQEAVKSWIYVDHSSTGRTLVEGQAWEVPVEYYLDPSEDKGDTLLTLWGGGPWIDNPDGKYTESRHHESYPGLYKSVKVEAGRGRHVFALTVPPALPQNAVLLIARFADASGEWPWVYRRGRMWFVRKGGYFELETEKPGNLFTYEEPVRIVARLKNVKTSGERKTLTYKVYDVTGAVVAKGQVPFTVQRDGQEVPIDLKLESRGTFLIEAEVPGWEKRETTFCRIPDVLAITGGAPTRFGMTNVVKPGPPERTEELCRVARRLGLTSCRIMDRWYDIEPGPGVYKLDPWEQAFEIAGRNGIEAWFCVYGPPAWALAPGTEAQSYSAVRVDWDAWRDFVQTVTARLKGKLYGWEWLNEITPGGTDDPVKDYVTMCRIGTQTAKRVDPDIVTIMAGGLWPRSFRIEMLKAGVAQYVDVMPIHYSNGGAVREARADLVSVGAGHVAVWEDESARGLNAWNVPPLEELQNTTQANWVLTQWPDELAAGCERIIYFGGGGSPAGNWTYLLGDLRPRPVAATLAVFTSKMFAAQPLGVFSLGEGGLFHLFERDGKPVMVCSTYASQGEKVGLYVGTDRVRVTDYQGNETAVGSTGGVARLDLTAIRCFVEDADLDVLKAYVVPEILMHQAALKRSQLAEVPRTTMRVGEEGKLLVRVRNLYDRDLGGTVRFELPQSWPAVPQMPFLLKPGEERFLPVSVTVPEGAAVEDYPVAAVFEFTWAKLPEITKPFVISVLSADMLGNLIRNSGFEDADGSGEGPEGWRVNGQTSLWASADALGLGLGERVLKYTNSENYVSTSQSLGLRGGQTYLYTAWVWNRNMDAGSNVYLDMADGSRKALYNMQVFTAGGDNPYWQMYTSRIKTAANLETASFAPLAIGQGWALFDNVRVTLFEGTDFAAECYRAPQPPRIDGKLDDWVTRCPIPLVGRNQLTVLDESYQWSPENLNAVGYLMWDDSSLYLALEVLDDAHHTIARDEGTVRGDSVILAFDPTNRGSQAPAKAFAYYVSSAVPGGGSGVHTIYRPERHSGGLRTGHLFRDSSVYEMAITRDEGRCVYEMRMPWRELGGIEPAFGGRFAFSIQLNDNDGEGLSAHINWGGGISPAWTPADFGVVTFLE